MNQAPNPDRFVRFMSLSAARLRRRQSGIALGIQSVHDWTYNRNCNIVALKTALIAWEFDLFLSKTLSKTLSSVQPRWHRINFATSQTSACMLHKPKQACLLGLGDDLQGDTHTVDVAKKGRS